MTPETDLILIARVNELENKLKEITGQLETNKAGLSEAKATIEQLNKSLTQGNRLTIWQFIFFVASLVGVLWIGIGMIDRRIDDLNRKMDERFEAVDKRFEAVDKRFDDLNRRLDDLRQIMLEQQKRRYLRQGADSIRPLPAPSKAQGGGVTKITSVMTHTAQPIN
jgi:chaperonin cofactor prefoldin